jgi:hypothetical protein
MVHGLDDEGAAPRPTGALPRDHGRGAARRPGKAYDLKEGLRIWFARACKGRNNFYGGRQNARALVKGPGRSAAEQALSTGESATAEVARVLVCSLVAHSDQFSRTPGTGAQLGATTGTLSGLVGLLATALVLRQDDRNNIQYLKVNAGDNTLPVLTEKIWRLRSMLELGRVNKLHEDYEKVNALLTALARDERYLDKDLPYNHERTVRYLGNLYHLQRKTIRMTQTSALVLAYLEHLATGIEFMKDDLDRLATRVDQEMRWRVESRHHNCPGTCYGTADVRGQPICPLGG